MWDLPGRGSGCVARKDCINCWLWLDTWQEEMGPESNNLV